MGAKSKHLLWFLAGVGVGFAAASAWEVVEFLARRPAEADFEAADRGTDAPAASEPELQTAR